MGHKLKRLIGSSLLLFHFVSFSTPECITITHKEVTSDNKYYFHWGNFNQNRGDPENRLDVRSGSVTQEEFQEYEVSDRYCLE